MTAAVEPFSHRTHTQTIRVVEGQEVPVATRQAEVQALVDAWNAANPEIATPFGRENLAPADIFESVRRVREGGDEIWDERFAADPDLMWMLIGDLVRYHSSDEFERGSRPPSRRRTQEKDRNLDAVWRIISPRFSTDPFPVAVRELIGERSLRWFAKRSGFGSHQSLLRYISGERVLTMDALEAMARAGRVSPFYFAEYRSLWLCQAVFEIFYANPAESVKIVRALRAGRAGSNGSG